ncbi:hypothetical protein KBP46_17200 [Chryseobacterium sp. PCH239]|uniref:hypothetical protein n=1 Tax=Chryseobacterium sp. PCH239 TaxID=2825845 RepID=UPI001C0F51A8|nr:hypothetical protein [Chryseobacterium sp. PCH239]QWT85196.1 hypothetical protein KBP46_17200 [Chryseobacterium sp. PCH239]
MKVANMEHVKSRYGDLYWDYAMTFGQFGESYLLVPVVKDNRVVLLMEAVREGNKVYFFEKEDKGKIDFFQAVIFSKITDYGEKTDSQNSTSSRNTPVFQCNTRWITIGCTDKEPNCIPYTTSETICKWIPGTTPKTFDPIGMDDGGGGGNGYEYQDPPEEKNPCEKMKSILTNPQVQAKIKELKAQSKSSGEIGVKIKADGTTSGIIPGGDHYVNFGDKTGYVGGYHNHTPTGIPMLSPNDIDQLLGFARAQPTSNPENVNNAYLVMVATNGMHYVIRFSGTYENAIKTFSQDDLNYYKDLMSMRNTMYKPSNYEGYEKLFFKILTDMGLEGQINLQRIESDGVIKNVTKNNDGTITGNPCS